MALFSWKLVSHKLIRWFVPFLLITTFLSNLVLIGRGGFQSHPYYTLLFAIQGLFYFSALLGYGLAVNQPISKSANYVSRFTHHASVLFYLERLLIIKYFYPHLACPHSERTGLED